MNKLSCRSALFSLAVSFLTGGVVYSETAAAPNIPNIDQLMPDYPPSWLLKYKVDLKSMPKNGEIMHDKWEITEWRKGVKFLWVGRHINSKKSDLSYTLAYDGDVYQFLDQGKALHLSKTIQETGNFLPRLLHPLVTPYVILLDDKEGSKPGRWSPEWVMDSERWRNFLDDATLLKRAQDKKYGACLVFLREYYKNDPAKMRARTVYFAESLGYLPIRDETWQNGIQTSLGIIEEVMKGPSGEWYIPKIQKGISFELKDRDRMETIVTVEHFELMEEINDDLFLIPTEGVTDNVSPRLGVSVKDRRTSEGVE